MWLLLVNYSIVRLILGDGLVKDDGYEEIRDGVNQYLELTCS